MSKSRNRRAQPDRTTTDPGPEPTPAPAHTYPKRPYVYAALDVLFAVIYITVARFAHSSSADFEVASYVLAGVMLVAAVGMAARRPWGFWLGVAGSVFLLLFAFVLIALLVMSAAFLSGVFGALGSGAASFSLLIAALVVEAYVLLPAFQLAYLLSAAGKREVRRTA